MPKLPPSTSLRSLLAVVAHLVRTSSSARVVESPPAEKKYIEYYTSVEISSVPRSIFSRCVQKQKKRTIRRYLGRRCAYPGFGGSSRQQSWREHQVLLIVLDVTLEPHVERQTTVFVELTNNSMAHFSRAHDRYDYSKTRRAKLDGLSVQVIFDANSVAECCPAAARETFLERSQCAATTTIRRLVVQRRSQPTRSRKSNTPNPTFPSSTTIHRSALL